MVAAIVPENEFHWLTTNARHSTAVPAVVNQGIKRAEDEGDSIFSHPNSGALLSKALPWRLHRKSQRFMDLVIDLERAVADKGIGEHGRHNCQSQSPSYQPPARRT